jgi:hypothetical protein
MSKKLHDVVRRIGGMIIEIRGERVILDSDLAVLFGVTTKALNQAVQRNISRFPVDFMFRIDHQEYAYLRSQFVTSSLTSTAEPGVKGATHGGRRVLPFAFTEHGALMVANILRSSKAVEMSVFIVRAFVRMRGALVSQYEMASRLDQIENILLVHDTQLKDLFDSIRPLLLPPPDPPSNPIGFSVREES